MNFLEAFPLIPSMKAAFIIRYTGFPHSSLTLRTRSNSMGLDKIFS
jgi:hypothetical protein